MCFSFGHLARCWLPEQVQVQVERLHRRIWHEKLDRTQVSSFWFQVSNGSPRLRTQCAPETCNLLTVKFNNQLLIHRQLNFFSLGQRQHATLVVVAIDLQPVRRVLMTGEVLGQLQHGQLAPAAATWQNQAGTQRYPTAAPIAAAGFRRSRPWFVRLFRSNYGTALPA